jgi:glucokinase
MKERCAIGIDLGASQIKCGIVSEKGRVKFRQISPTLQEKGPAQIVQLLKEVAQGLVEYSRPKKLQIAGIGIGSPGTVELKSGKVVGASPNIPGWTGVSLKQIFRRFKLPVYADNDANLMALAESRVGAARGYDGAICLTIGTGIGGGLVLHGQVYRGAASSAGELGHTCIAYDGRLCRCGAKGCLEVYASVPALLKAARLLIESSENQSMLRANLRNLSPKLILQAAGKGDEIALQLLEDEIAYLSAGLASVVNLLNPEVIVVGGGFVEAGTSFLHQLEKRIKERAFPSAVRGLKVVRARLGNDAGFIGAALYCLESLPN